MRAILFLLTKGVRELHVNKIGNNFTALPKGVTEGNGFEGWQTSKGELSINYEVSK